MKIVAICPFSLDRLTGTPIRVKTTARALSVKNDVTILSTFGESGSRYVVRELGNTRLLGFTFKSVGALRSIKPDVLHVFTTAGVLAALIYKLCFKPSTKIVFESHGFAWYELKGQFFIKRFLFLLLDIAGLLFANRIIAMSHSQANFLNKFVLNKNKIQVIWGSINSKVSFSPMNNQNKKLVGYVGNSSWWQGLPLIIDSAKILLKSHPEIRFNLAGFDFSDKDKFPELGNVSYFGKVSRQVLEELLNTSSVLLSPRVPERVSELQFPHKLAEYVSASRPIIVSNVSDQSMIINEAKCGLVVRELNAENLAQSIVDLFSLGESERELMGLNAFKYAENHFGFDVFQSHIETLFDGLSSRMA